MLLSLHCLPVAYPVLILPHPVLHIRSRFWNAAMLLDHMQKMSQYFICSFCHSVQRLPEACLIKSTASSRLLTQHRSVAGRAKGQAG